MGYVRKNSVCSSMRVIKIMTMRMRVITMMMKVMRTTIKILKKVRKP